MQYNGEYRECRWEAIAMVYSIFLTISLRSRPA